MTAFDIAPDWLSFSLKTGDFDNSNDALKNVSQTIGFMFGRLKPDAANHEKARSPYTMAFHLGIGGIVYLGLHTGHALVEIHGKGCRHLHDTGSFRDIARLAQKMSMNITRFDLAVDFETSISPVEFTASAKNRMTAGGVMHSETGITCYIGAPKSRKRARVYRYFPPHERAHLLRVEMIVKKPDANAALAAYLDVGGKEYAAALGNSFGWKHALWEFASDRKISSWRPEVGQAGTMRWLMSAVVPAVERLVKDGALRHDSAFFDAIADARPDAPSVT